MGIFNVIKLANDYNTAKKLLKEKDVQQKLERVKQALANLQEYIVELETMKDMLADYIANIKSTMRKLHIESQKGGKQ